MSSAFNKEVRRSISHSLGRFVAIAVIAALGCGFYAGLRMTPLDMNLSADTFYDQTNFSDIYVSGTLGLDDASIRDLREVDGVYDVQPERIADAYALIDDIKYVVRFNSIEQADSAMSSEYMNRPELVEGRLPENDSECVLSADAVLDERAHVGQKISIVDMKSAVADTFKVREFTVVGLVRSPYYVCTSQLASSELGSGEIDTYAYVLAGAFADGLPYTGAYVTVANAKEELYPSSSYDAVVDPVKQNLEDAGEGLATARLAAVRSDASKKLDDARLTYENNRSDALEKLDAASDELAHAKAELDDAKAELQQNQIELDANEARLEDAQNQLDAAPAELDAKQAEIETAQGQYETGAQQLAQAREEAARRFDAAEAAIGNLPAEQQPAARAQLEQERQAAQEQLDARQEDLDAARAQIEAGVRSIAQGRSQLESSRAEIVQGLTALESGRSQIETGWEQYYDGLSRYESGRAEFETQRAETLDRLAEAKAELDDAQSRIDTMEAPDWYVLDRSKNLGAASRTSDAERIDQISRVFPFIFFLVAALVSLTTMTRMVDEERMLIGTHKALGYSNARISSKYLIYAFIASATGCLLGVLALTQFLPQFIMAAYSTIYAIPVAVSPIDPLITCVAFGLTVGITVGATLFAVLSSLRERPALLMLPRVPKPGKRILLERLEPLWRRLSFTGKVTARNIFRYKRRFSMAIIGIAGCTALLLTGLGLHDGINDIISKQFNEILHYNLEIKVSEDQNAQEATQVDDILNANEIVGARTRIANETTITKSEGGNQNVRTSLCVAQDTDAFEAFVTLRTRRGHEPLNLTDSGVVISEKLATQLGVSVGDTVEVYAVNVVGDATGQARAVTVSGICEYYTGQRIFMSPRYYEDVFGHSAQFNDILCMAQGPISTRTALSDELLGVGGVEVVSYYDEVIQTYQKMLETVNAVVVVLVVAAALLAFVVLYNLTNINISERVREIATLKVLGFTPREVSAYIYHETILLTLIGALLGCVLGVFVEGFVVVTAEVDQIMFGREIHLASFGIALALTMLFSIIVSVAMKPKLDKIDMVESLKSVD